MIVIVGITGRAQHGKDTAANVLIEEFGFTRYGLADPLKEIALAIDPIIDSELRLGKVVALGGWEAAKKYPEVRRFLQALGTEGIREHLDEDAWVRHLERRLAEDRPKRVVVPDVRFPNEARWVRVPHLLDDCRGYAWRISRLGSDGMLWDNGLGDHPSETHVPFLDVDTDVRAVTVDELQQKIRILGERILT